LPFGATSTWPPLFCPEKPAGSVDRLPFAVSWPLALIA